MALVAFCLLWRCCTGMLHAAHSLLCRPCLLQVRRDRDAYALAFCSSSGKRFPPRVLRLECITQHAGQSQQLLEAIHELALVAVGEKSPPKEEAPYSYGRASSCARSCSTPTHAHHRLVEMTLRMSLDARMCVCKNICNI